MDIAKGKSKKELRDRYSKWKSKKELKDGYSKVKK